MALQVLPCLSGPALACARLSSMVEVCPLLWVFLEARPEDRSYCFGAAPCSHVCLVRFGSRRPWPLPSLSEFPPEGTCLLPHPPAQAGQSRVCLYCSQNFQTRRALTSHMGRLHPVFIGLARRHAVGATCRACLHSFHRSHHQHWHLVHDLS